MDNEMIAVRERLKVLINILPYTFEEIAKDIGIAYITFTNFIYEKKAPKRLTFIKIRHYVDEIENRMNLEEGH